MLPINVDPRIRCRQFERLWRIDFLIMEPNIRQRKSVKKRKPEARLPPENEIAISSVKSNPSSTFWLTRIVFLRSLAAIYSVAFLIAYNQGSMLLKF